MLNLRSSFEGEYERFIFLCLCYVTQCYIFQFHHLHANCMTAASLQLNDILLRLYTAVSLSIVFGYCEQSSSEHT